MKFELGEKAKDKLTEFEGIVTARCEFLNGCIQYELQPTKLKDGIPQVGIWIDEVQLVEHVTIKKPNRPKSVCRRIRSGGGPARVPPTRSMPN